MTRIISNIKNMAIAAVAFSGVMLGGCVSDNPEVPGSSRAGCISLTLRSSRAGTRANEADVDALNENLITSAVLCFYPSENPGNKPIHVEYVTGLDTNTTETVEVALSTEMKDTLFPEGTDVCGVYVIANPSPGMQQVTTEMTLDDIRQLSISADFASSEVQPSFTMDGSAENIQIYNRGTTYEYATGNVYLQRCASKITLAIDVAENVEVDSPDGIRQVWEPLLSDMSVLITDGVTRSQISSMSYEPGDNDYYSTYTSAQDVTHRQRALTNEGGTADYPYVLQSPFYTFPTKWEPTEPDSRQLYMTLMVPWRLKGEQSYRTCYYMVPVIKGAEIGRNVSYRVNLKVSMLGSFTPDEPFELSELSYYATDWGTVSNDVNLADTRYLVVDRHSYVMNNERRITIPFYTSHETVVKSVTMTYFRYRVTDQGFETPINIKPEQYQETITRTGNSIYTCDFHNATQADPSNYLDFDHELVVWKPMTSGGAEITFPQNSQANANTAIESIYYYTRSDEAAYSRYVTTITIAHKDRPDEYQETIVITQYPQMYINSTQNAYTGSNVSAREGNLWVNGHQSTQFGDNNRDWYVTYGLATGSQNTNANPNQYVITVTQLNEGENYIIGDPRVSEYTDLYGWMTWEEGEWWWTTTHYFGEANARVPDHAWATAPDMEGTERKLTYYYPTDQSSSKARWIAPSFRIASSFGVCFENTYAANKARCASYQELSRPAGRWRMPTVAEIEYIMKLSQDGKIPVLFNANSYYMSAQGIISTNDLQQGFLNTPSNTSGQSAVRCVYDEWYWGNDTIVKGNNGYYPFTWGDRERTAPQ